MSVPLNIAQNLRLLEQTTTLFEQLVAAGEIRLGKLTPKQTDNLIRDLPTIHEKKLIELGEKDNFCPICFVPYLTILTEEEMAHAMDSPAHPVEELGVTKLSQPWQCGHMFCRRDISKWIKGGNDSCPMCRRLLIERAEEESTEGVPSNEEAPVPATVESRTAAMPTILNDLNISASRLEGVLAMLNSTAPPSRWQINSRAAATEHDHPEEYSGMYS